MIDAGSHPDFQLVYKELARFHEDARVRGRVMQELGIDVIAGFLLNPAYRAASRERGKVFVVLEAELMSAEAQNSLLKTLEEPPPGVTIVLLAERPEQMLPTTVSRCAVVRFRLLPREFVVSRLLEAEVPPPEAEFWAAFTEGSLGRALKLAKEDFYELKRDLLGRLAALREAGDAELGAYLTTKMEKLADAAVKALKAEQGAELSTMLANRRAAGTMLELIASGFRDAMKLNAAAAEGQAPPPLINADQAPAVRSLAERFDGGQLAGIIEQLSEYEELLWRNANPKIIWDNVVITCATAAALRF
jgi:DNA polymerase-3 subunit delta'